MYQTQNFWKQICVYNSYIKHVSNLIYEYIKVSWVSYNIYNSKTVRPTSNVFYLLDLSLSRIAE